METIKAPNGTTTFIKPDFDVVLYEEVENVGIYGRVGTVQLHWNTDGYCCKANSGSTTRIVTYDLTPAPKPWYENIGEGVLCRVWDEDGSCTVSIVTSYCPETKYPYIIIDDSAWEHATPLTPEEVMKYVVK